MRVGSAFLGACRTQKRGSQLRPVYHGEAILDTVRWLPKGHTVGNEVITILHRPTRVGIIPVGYHHGFGIQRAPQERVLGVLQGLAGSPQSASSPINGQKGQ